MSLAKKNFFVLFYTLSCSIFFLNLMSGVKSLQPIESVKPSSKKSEVNKKESKAIETDYDAKKQIVFGYSKDELYMQSKVGQQARENMKKLEDSIVAQLSPMMEKMTALNAEYEQKAKTAKRESLIADEQKMGELWKDFQVLQAKLQDEYKAEDNRAMREVLKAIDEAVREFMARSENEFVLLVPTDNYINSRYNSTSQLLEIMDANFEKTKKAAKVSTKK